MASKSGYCKAKGSMHMPMLTWDPGANGIVGGGLPIA
jgi:hypothetical protein